MGNLSRLEKKATKIKQGLINLFCEVQMLEMGIDKLRCFLKEDFEIGQYKNLHHISDEKLLAELDRRMKKK